MKYSILITFSIVFAMLLNGCGLSTTTTDLGGTVNNSIAVAGTAKKGVFTSLNLTLRNPASPTSVLGSGTSTNGEFNVTFNPGITIPKLVLVEITGNYISEAGGVKAVAASQPLSTIIEIGTVDIPNVAITPFTSLLVSHMGSDISTQSLADAKGFVAETFGLDIQTVTNSANLSSNPAPTSERSKYNMLLAGISQLADDKTGIGNLLKEFGNQAKEGFITTELMTSLSSSITKVSTDADYLASSDYSNFSTGLSGTLIDKIKTGSLWEKTKIASNNPNRTGHVGFATNPLSETARTFYFWGGKSGNASNTVTNSVLRYSYNLNLSSSTTCGAARAYHSIAMAPNMTTAYAFGGVDSLGHVTNALDIFNLSSGTCTGSTTYGGLPRAHHSSFFYNNNLYFVGGMGSSSAVTDINVYSIPTGTWSTATITGTTVAPRFGHTTVWDKPMKRALTWGGTSSQSHQGSVQSLAFTSSSIVSSLIASGGLARTGHTGDFYDNGVQPRMLFFGGASGASDTLTNSMQIYDFSSNTFKTYPSKATARKGMSSIKYYSTTKNSYKILYFGGEKAGSVVTNEIDIFTIPRSSKR